MTSRSMLVTRKIELPVVLEVGGDDDSSPILFVEFVIAVDIIDGDSDVSKPSWGDIDGVVVVVLLDVAEEVPIIVGGYVGDENVCVVDVVAEEGIAVWARV